MGYIRHNAIIVTVYEDHAQAVHETACAICGDLVSDRVKAQMNGYQTFLIAPDGSKEGWSHSNDGDDRRSRFRTALREMADNWWCEWVEIAYGNDDAGAKVVASSWADSTADSRTESP